MQKKRFLLLDSTGLGKTYSVLGAYAILQRMIPGIKLLVVCSVKGSSTWKKQILKHTHFTYKVYYTSKASELDTFQSPSDVKEDISILPYPALSKYPNLLRARFKDAKTYLVVDECHRIKDPSSIQGQLVRALINLSTQACGLTATLLLNHIEDVFHVEDAFFPGRLAPDLETFMRRYTIRFKRKVTNHKNGRTWTFQEVTGYKNLDHLTQCLEGTYLKRYRDLDIRHHPIQVVLRDEEEDLYIEAAKGLLALEYKDFAARLPDLQLVANGTLGSQGEFDVCRKYVSSKELSFLELLNKLLSAGKSVVAFTYHRKTHSRLTHLIKNHLTACKKLYLLTGDTSSKEVDRIESEFSSSAEIVFMTSAGGESLNLQASNVVVFFDLPFSVGTLIQIIGRVARMDSAFDFMDVYYLVAGGTVDFYKAAMIEVNSKLIKEVLGGNANLPKTSGKTTKRMLMELRKDLLWKIREQDA